MLRHVIRDAVEVTSYCSSGRAAAIFSIFIDYDINNIRFQACACVPSNGKALKNVHVLIVNQLFVQNNKDNVTSLLRGVFVVLCERMLGRRSDFHRHIAVGSKVLGKKQSLCLFYRPFVQCRFNTSDVGAFEVGFSTVNM